MHAAIDIHFSILNVRHVASGKILPQKKKEEEKYAEQTSFSSMFSFAVIRTENRNIICNSLDSIHGEMDYLLL